MKRQWWYFAAVACVIAIVLIVDYAQTFGIESSPVVGIFCLFFIVMFWICVIFGISGKSGLPINKIINNIEEKKMNRLILSFLILIYWIAALAGIMTFIVFSLFFWYIAIWSAYNLTAKDFPLSILYWLATIVGLVLNFKIVAYLFRKTRQKIDEKSKLFLQNETAKQTAERLEKEWAERIREEARKREEDYKRSIIEAKQRAEEEFKEKALTWSNQRIREELDELRDRMRENRSELHRCERKIENIESSSSWPGRRLDNLENEARFLEDENDIIQNKIDYLKSILQSRRDRTNRRR